MTRDEIQEGVNKRKWFHRIPLKEGISTPGYREPDAWQMYKLPELLEGKRVLDIGAWDGQFSFEAERRGAAMVVAMDVWGNENHEPGSEGHGWDNFQFCHSALESHVIPQKRNVYELERSFGEFDLILFLEVLYHLQDPIRGLRCVRSVLAPGGMVCLETWIDALSFEEPAMIFYPGGELNNDVTNWWGPNFRCVEEMTKAAGFSQCDLVWQRTPEHLNGRGRRACFHLRAE